MMVSEGATIISIKKPPGRPKGSQNRATKEIRQIAAKHGRKAVRELYKLMVGSENEQTRLRAATELLDRGFGRPTQTTELTGKDGGPVATASLIADVSARVADVFGNVAGQEGAANALGDDEMKAVMSLNYLNAVRQSMPASTAGDQAADPAVASPAPAPASLSVPQNTPQDESRAPAPIQVEDASPDAAQADLEALQPGHEINISWLTIRCREPSRPGLPNQITVHGNNDALLVTMPSVERALSWVKAKFPDLADEKQEIRKTPLSPIARYRAVDQYETAPSMPQVQTRRRR
jgi:hypothetical protein